MDERPRAQHAALAGLFLLLRGAFTRANLKRLPERPEAGDWLSSRLRATT